MKKIPSKKLCFSATTIASLTNSSGGVLRTFTMYSVAECVTGAACPTAPGGTNQLTDSCNPPCGIWCVQNSANVVTSCA